jgi:hypothetical protein
VQTDFRTSIPVSTPGILPCVILSILSIPLHQMMPYTLHPPWLLTA